jgi:hypothetical protein
MTHDAVARHEPRRHRAEGLHFFAAHHVGARSPRTDPRYDRRTSRFWPRQTTREIRQAHRARHVGRLEPASVRADHAGHQQRMIAKPRASLGHRIREPLHGQDALAVLEP